MGGSDQAPLGADPFEDHEEAVPRISPMTPPRERRALVAELRGLVDRDAYEIPAEIVALAVMKHGQMIHHDEDE